MFRSHLSRESRAVQDAVVTTRLLVRVAHNALPNLDTHLRIVYLICAHAKGRGM